MRAKLLPVGCAASSEIKCVDAGERLGGRGGITENVCQLWAFGESIELPRREGSLSPG